ncbi:Gfo/Idh/MocA family protein [Paenibacillus sp. DMB20]|uniref:Gfo/Idh/MocA family protein n=1 Tax=Paenibacillus sp. DMB20 TaxID=1642570 RepID=UPI0006281270|nr:Gfo/Idh/MocA family oxidoreductase [Paenibacillus sp. DMB20]KKO51266.1 oxidoreductase [Paenibacillus sp. DMB20]
MQKLKIGVIGLGMGYFHARTLAAGAIRGACLAAVCDVQPAKREMARAELPEEVSIWEDAQAMMASGELDAVIIATPHYGHPEEAIFAFGQGLHVLIEKPAGVYTKQVREMNRVAAGSGKVFSIMYNQRCNPLYRKLRELIADGELGDIRRMNWIVTHWYRSQSYYDSGGWRATWAGEGGGVLINQSPHQLDLWQWTTGLMPRRIRAFCSFGKYRNIEVEDDVTAYAEYENGATGIFITTTGEAPGSNRFEVTGDRGKIVVEDEKLTFWRLRVPEPQFNREYAGGFGQPECWKCEIPVSGDDPHHAGIIQNFTDAILHGVPLIAPGEEGIKGLTLSNAMHLSSWKDDWVTLPLDEELYHEQLQERIRNSTYQKEVRETGPADMSKTFG